jgi:hypothetical protein
MAEFPPFASTNYVMMLRRPDEPAGAGHMLLTRSVTPNYFALLGVPIVKGRVQQRNAGSTEIVVSEAVARMLWPGADPIGQTLQNFLGPAESETVRVVGVAKDVAIRSMSGLDPVIYRNPTIASTLLVRRPSRDTLERIRMTVGDLLPGVKIEQHDFLEYMRDAVSMAVLSARVAWSLGAIGLVLAISGAFGLFAFAVENRRREIGIRRALGARDGQILWLVLQLAGRALIFGLAMGTALTLMATPALRYVLFGISPVAPTAWLEVAALLAVAVGLATWLPVRRAVAVDPATTLRAD